MSSSSSSSGLELNFYHLVSPIFNQMADLHKWYISFNSKLWIGIPWNFLWIDKDVEIGTTRNVKNWEKNCAKFCKIRYLEKTKQDKV